MPQVRERVRSLIPATYDALAGSTVYGGIEQIQRVIESTKYRLFATVVTEAVEASVYDAFTLDFTAKVATVRIIPGAADYWASTLRSVQTNEESAQYYDRVQSLWTLHERLTQEVKQDQPYFESLWKTGIRRRGSTPRVSTMGSLLTPDPADWGAKDTSAPFGSTAARVILPWSEWAS